MLQSGPSHTTRTYDTDGKISQIVSAGTKTYSYDDAFRITGLTDTSPGAANWTYGYDSLDRLTSGTSPSTTRGWTYDANGNRLTETGTAASTYSISPSSNRISGITGTLARTYTYDTAGNGINRISPHFHRFDLMNLITCLLPRGEFRPGCLICIVSHSPRLSIRLERLSNSSGQQIRIGVRQRDD